MDQLNFKPFPELTTENFILRQLTEKDESEIFILRSDPRIIKYLDRPKAESIEDARAFISKINKLTPDNKWIYWAICRKGESELIGTICLWNITESPFKADIGFELLPELQGKGIMQEVIPEVLNYGFNNVKFEKIIGETSPGNIKSIKIMEKFGFSLESYTETFLTYALKKEKYSDNFY